MAAVERVVASQVLASRLDPLLETAPVGEQCLVGELDRRSTRDRVAVEREQSVLDEGVDDDLEIDHVDVE